MAVDKLVDSTQLDADLTSVANAIRTKGGTSASLAFPNDFVSAVQAIPTGGVTPTGTKSITENGTGIDVYSYQYADVAVPNSYSQSDEGKVVSNGALVAQSSDTVTTNNTYDTTLINSLTVNVSGGTPDWREKDGKTYLHINIELAEYLTVNMFFTQSVSGANTVDWGDNTSTTPTGTSRQTLTHTYSALGEYVITITNTGGYFYFGSSSTTSGYIFNESGVNSSAGKYQNYTSILRRVELGNGWAINQGRQFANCKCLKNVYINNAPSGTKFEINMFNGCTSLIEFDFADGVLNSVTTCGTHVFPGCPALAKTKIPPKLTAVSNNWFTNDYALAKAEIPSGVSGIATKAFSGCSNLISIELPATITSISATAFESCFGLHEIHMKPTTPPTLENSNAFSLTNANAHSCVIYVPYSADHSILNSYKTASNWSTFASYMQEESA